MCGWQVNCVIPLLHAVYIRTLVQKALNKFICLLSFTSLYLMMKHYYSASVTVQAAMTAASVYVYVYVCLGNVLFSLFFFLC